MISRGNKDSSAARGRFDPALDERLISGLRLILAAVAFLELYLDPSQPGRLVELTYSLLVLYTIYSALILGVSFFAARLLPAGKLHWFDVGWFGALLAVSSSSGSLFFCFSLIAILGASFRWGSSSGRRMTVASIILAAAVACAAPLFEPHFEVRLFLVRAVALCIVGYMIAHWGGAEVTLKRRLQFLKDITSLSNPRFGIDRTISWSGERLRAFYDADQCLLIQPLRDAKSYRLTRVDREGSGTDQGTFTQGANAELASLLLSPELSTALVYNRRSLQQYDMGDGKSAKEPEHRAAAIAGILNTKSFVSIPILYRGQPRGRLYLVGGRQRRDKADIDFVLEVIEHLTPLLDNIRLVDRLASDAAEQERQKLARDIHDSVIQPYIGLQLGLAAVRAKMMNGHGDALVGMNELCELAKDEMKGLRFYLNRLKSGAGGDGVLLPAVRRFATKYSAVTGITVQVKGVDGLRLNDRLAGEAFQMVAEGLSNVRRHTNARQAEVEVSCDATDLILRIMNDNRNGEAKASFQPNSISERATALGGDAHVYNHDDRTVIDVRIPL